MQLIIYELMRADKFKISKSLCFLFETQDLLDRLVSDDKDCFRLVGCSISLLNPWNTQIFLLLSTPLC